MRKQYKGTTNHLFSRHYFESNCNSNIINLDCTSKSPSQVCFRCQQVYVVFGKYLLKDLCNLLDSQVSYHSSGFIDNYIMNYLM